MTLWRCGWWPVRIVGMSLAALVLLATTGPGAVAGTLTAEATVVDPGCSYLAGDMGQNGLGGVNADAATGADGLTHGFVNFDGVTPMDDCGIVPPAAFDGSLIYFKGSGTDWETAVSPYRGGIMAVATDTTGAYVLFQNGYDDTGASLWIGKYHATGGFAAPVRVATLKPMGGGAVGGDLIARDGKWWAVWVENVDEESSIVTDALGLFQAKTIGRRIGRQRIRTGWVENEEPSLAYDEGRRRAVLAWSCRHTFSGLCVATSTDGSWPSQPNPIIRKSIWDGEFEQPQVVVRGTTTFVSFDRNYKITVARTTVHGWKTTVLNRTGYGMSPWIATSAGRVFVAYTLGGHDHLAQLRSDGTWADTTGPETFAGPIALTASAGRATLLSDTSTALVARTIAG
jgi:hypothetical protein